MTDLEKLQTLIEKGLRTNRLDSGAFSAWQTQCLNFLESKLSASSPYFQSFREKVQQGHTDCIKSGIGILEALKEDLEADDIALEGPRYDPLQLIGNICERFDLIVRQLRSRYKDRNTIDVQDEYDVQDLMHSLLHLYFNDIRSEEWTPSYAGKSSRMDFLLKQEQIVIETKKTRNGLGAKEIGTQLIEDIARYQSHPDCDTLVCFVYDPDGRISNPRGIENDLRRAEGDPKVEVWIRP